MPKDLRKNARWSINAISVSPAALDWLTTAERPRILHVFDRACNLINERGDILSIVTPEIGEGPFNLVIEENMCFANYLKLQSPVFITPTQLLLENLTVETTSVKEWDPRPDWKALHDRRNDILDQVMSLSDNNDPALDLEVSLTTNTIDRRSQIADFSLAFVRADIPHATQLTSQLAGLGIGLTPAGDDFILGAMLAARIVHPPEIAGVLAEQVTNAAAPLTTSLSAAWLKSVGKGEAGISWHHLFEALVSGNHLQIREAVSRILAIGATSGADALAGFMDVFQSLKELSASEASRRIHNL